MKKILAIVGFSLASSAAWAMPVGAIHLKARVISFDKNWVKLECAGKRVQLPRTSLGDQKIETTGKAQNLALSPDDYFKMKQRYLLGLTK